ncbi:glycosyltransferase family 34 protein [Pleomassaria siparia CBS 279.74]|uniref:Glycosyltransferase family 34 protein n=1 Tax=Pleomassaria siparia CBS 279.74 TaxID=1314801 RepID=A0A6G1KPY2_9PLEO|nr:glycosyltransferase family 34 protein [Pleomassaria siparia CBS 279.74]
MPSPLPTTRRRYVLPSTSRYIKYVLIIAFALLTVALWKRQDLQPAVAQYLPGSVDDVKAVETPPSGEDHNENTDTDTDTDTVPAPDDETPPNENTLPKNPADKSTYPKFGKITATFGEPETQYEDAIASHALHNSIHGYPHFILRERMMRGLWSKHAWMMAVIGQELAKPEDQRLDWVMWHDRDVILMNPQLPLAIFVPPEPDFGHVHMLVTNDSNGLNNGVFLCRVSQWSFKLFASALSIREYEPETPLKYTEQSGMEEALKRPWWATGTVFVPQRWFNGFPPNARALARGKPSASRPGSLLIHFASNRDGLRPERLAHWGEVATSRTKEWDKPLNETGYSKEIAEFWQRLGKGESQEALVKAIGVYKWT